MDDKASEKQNAPVPPPGTKADEGSPELEGGPPLGSADASGEQCVPTRGLQFCPRCGLASGGYFCGRCGYRFCVSCGDG
jgi:hypothetical protein